MKSAFLVLLVGVSLSPAAHACTCAGYAPDGADSVPFIPQQGSVNVATNATIWWLRDEMDHLEEPTVLVDGVLWSGGQAWTREVGDRWEGYSLRLDDDLPAEAEVEVNWAAGGVLAFTTGTHRDEEPPSWNGEYEAAADKGELGTCGDYATVSVAFVGAEDDYSGADDIISVAGPREVGVLNVGDGAGFATSWGEVCGGDDSLSADLHRRYDVVLFDNAGNRTDSFEVSTRGQECGCNSAGSPGTWLTGFGLLLLFHRRRNTERSLGSKPISRRYPRAGEQSA